MGKKTLDPEIIWSYKVYRRYILKQIEVVEFEKAVEVAWKTLTQAGDALMVARALRAGWQR